MPALLFGDATPYAAPVLSAESQQRVLDFLRANGASPLGKIASHVGISVLKALDWMATLHQQGLVIPIESAKRTHWQLADLEVDQSLLRLDAVPQILARLRNGERGLASGIAQGLGLPLAEVRETLKWLRREGQVVGMPLAATTIYSLVERVQVTHDPERAASVGMSSEARMLAEIARLPPERRTFAPRPPAPVKPPADMKPVAAAARAARVKPRRARTLVNKKRVATTEFEGQKLVSVAGLKAVKPERVKKQPVKVRRELKAKVEQVVRIPQGYQIASEAARSIKVQPMALLKWLSNHDEAMKHCERSGKYLLVSRQALELYLQSITLKAAPEQLSEVPGGWLNIWSAVERVGWCHSKLYRMLQEGELKAVRVGGKMYFDPSALDALKAKLDAEATVPEGWLNVTYLCAELGGLDRSSVMSWMKRNGFESRKYRDPERQLAVYYPPGAAQAYRDHCQKHPGGIKVTPEIAQAIRDAAPVLPAGRSRHRPGVIPAIADQYGISSALVNTILRGAAHAEAAD